ncbi:flagellar protein FlaG [Pseudomonas sp. HR96]|uniref:flagellar protein FlaG n=1 Tax=Pseudomonas sp. HR96 TaxID=1027966 RepID=UPI002A749691|nr:flagellar protein FlaG [Pseudomonas sp. HR96]WPP01305.1 flagellar protein FlaG [Pseudomonas sp. HR96]
MDMSVSTTTQAPANAVQSTLPAGGQDAASVGKVAGSEPAAKAKPERAELEKAVKSIQDFADSSQRNLKFSIDEKSHQVVVKVIATQTGMVVRQIPDEAAVKLAQSLSETGSLLFDEKV